MFVFNDIACVQKREHQQRRWKNNKKKKKERMFQDEAGEQPDG